MTAGLTPRIDAAELKLVPAGGSDADTVLTTASSRFQYVTLSAARTYTLPSSGVIAGEIWTFVNKSAYKLSVNSSGANAVDNITRGRLVIQALQDAPTTAAHWMTIAGDSEWVSYTALCPWNNGGTSIHAKFRRSGSNIYIAHEIRFQTTQSGGYNQSYSNLLNGLGLTVDKDKLVKYGDGTYSRTILGDWAGEDAGNTTYGGFVAVHMVNDSIYHHRGSGDAVTSTTPFTFNNDDRINARYSFPITEWSMFN